MLFYLVCNRFAVLACAAAGGNLLSHLAYLIDYGLGQRYLTAERTNHRIYNGRGSYRI